MDGSSLPLPRLRVSRTIGSYPDDQNSTPLAGPSRLSPLQDDHEDDTQSTPRIAKQNLDTNNATPSILADTPAARLRALLARVPGDSPLANHTPRPPAPSSPSEADSDFYPPHLNSKSNPHESLKEIFSRALRDPGGTPKKSRRNSIDLSEVDASPRLDRVQTERAKSKGKRKSMSDEELEKVSKSSHSYSHTTTLRTLRDRLASSEYDVDLKDVAPPSDQSLSDASETNRDTAMILRPLHSPKPLPAVTATPFRPIQVPPQFENGSNLLDQDSEMQRAMKSMDSSEDGEFTHSVPFPPSKSTKKTPVLMKHGSDDISHKPNNSLLNQSKSHAIGQSKVSGLARHHSLGSSPRGDSLTVQSPSADISSKRNRVSQHHASGVQSPRTNSTLSRSDHKELTSDMQHDELKERERRWNRPNNTLNRSTSSLSVHERTRTISHPTRPDSVHALTVDRLELHRRSHSRNSMRVDSPVSSMTNSSDLDKDTDHHEVKHERERNWNAPYPKWNSTPTGPASPTPSTSSEHARLRHPFFDGGAPEGRRSRYNSLTSLVSSRASSPAGSLTSKGSQESVNHEIEQERERNWDAAHPKWTKRRSLQNLRSASPSPSSVPLSPRQTHTHSRDRAQSLTDGKSSIFAPRSSGSKPLSRSSLNVETLSFSSKIPVQRSTSPYQPTPPHTNDRLLRTKSPLPTPVSPSAHNSPGYSSNFGWKFHSQSHLPPLELDSEDQSPSAYRRTRPVSPKTSQVKSVNESDRPKPHDEFRRRVEDERHGKGHRRSHTEFSQAVGSIPLKIHAETVALSNVANQPVEAAVHGSDEDSPIGNTPLARPISLPLVSTSPPRHEDDLARLQKAISSPQSQTSTPPPSPSKMPADPVLSLSTPPRGSSSNMSKIEFQTPPPPKGLPDLPPLPSSPSDDSGDTPNNPLFPKTGNVTLMKTPKPPGAWLQTPGRTPTPNADLNGGIVTPPTTLTKRDSLSLQTPAAPGAWFATPGVGSVARKSILKVRFDVAPSETETVTSVDNRGDEISLDSIEMIHPSDEETPGSTQLQIGQEKPEPETLSTARLNINGHVSSATSPEGPTTPVLKPVRVPPTTPPSVRIVDAFGREHVDWSEEEIKTKDISPISLPPRPASPQRNKSSNGGIRIVDAMGRQVEAELPPLVDERKEPLTREQALSHVKENISSLAREMSDLELSSSDVDNSYLEGLRATSSGARNARHKIVQAIHIVEDDLRFKYGSLRESMRKSGSDPFPNVIRRSWLSRYQIITWVLCGALLQIVFIIFMNRLSHARARNLFLTNYYDPFYPNLHLHIVKPAQFMVTSPPSWSVYSVPDTFQRAGLGGVYSEFWGNVTLMLSSWQRQTWESWGSHEWTSSNAWPPT